MSARDELTTLILGKTAPRAADAIIASGYVRPRQVTTAEELDALPAVSVILDANKTPWVSDGDTAQPWASLCEDSQGGPIWDDSTDIALPATVLHEGGAA